MGNNTVKGCTLHLRVLKNMVSGKKANDIDGLVEIIKMSHEERILSVSQLFRI